MVSTDIDTIREKSNVIDVTNCSITEGTLTFCNNSIIFLPIFILHAEVNTYSIKITSCFVSYIWYLSF